MTEQNLSTATITDDDGATWTPYIGPNAELGYRVSRPGTEDRYVFLNVSGGSDDGVPTVFLYLGTGPTPEDSEPQVWVAPFDS